MKICGIVFLLIAAVHFSLFAAPDTTATVKRSTGQTVDSAVQSKKNAPSVNAHPASPAPVQNKIETGDKKTVIEEEDLLIEEGDVKKNAAREAAIKDSLAKLRVASPVHGDSAQAQKSDTLKNALPSEKVEITPVHKDSVVAAAPVQAEKKPLQQAQVESVHSINFAKNLKDYRSPKVAMFLSLVVPGLGQAYTKHYIKAGVFVAIEAAAIGLSVEYNAKGKRQYNDGIAFANQNFDFGKFQTYYNDLQTLFNSPPIANGGGGLGDSTAAQQKIDGIYYDSLHSIITAFNQKSPEFYRDLEGSSNIYVQGWNDCEPSLNAITQSTGSKITGKYFNYLWYPDADSIFYLVERIDPKDSTKVLEQGIFGYSPNQVIYTNMMSKSNDYYKLANTILALMIINHLASAVDALIGAIAYNNELLGRESIWQHIRIEPQCVADPVNPSFGLAFRMGF
ncbi:MAG: DUF5683 domain-containing protein [Chitinivibrionales bacterium]